MWTAILALVGSLLSIVDKVLPNRQQGQEDDIRAQGEKERAEIERIRQEYLRKHYSGD